MPVFTSDDELATVSQITIPADTDVRSESSRGEVHLSFGVDDRVILDIHPDMVGPIVAALRHGRSRCTSPNSCHR